MKCQKCKSTENLIINSRYKTKRGEEKINYMCRVCNLERSKKYRATPEGRKKLYGAVYRSTKKHWHKMLARQSINWHVRTGKIVKPDSCAHCKEIKKLEAHHEDYSKRLEVLWLCRSCHSAIHRLQLRNGN